MSQCGVGKINNPFGGCIDFSLTKSIHGKKTKPKKSAKKTKRTKSHALRLAGHRNQKDSYKKCKGGKDRLVFKNPFTHRCSSITLGSRRLDEAFKDLKKVRDTLPTHDFQKREEAINAKHYVDRPGPVVREYQKPRFIRVDVSKRGNR